MHYTRDQLEALPMPELLKLYNTITGKQTKKFESRAKGVEQLLRELAARVKIRTVRKSSEGEAKAGRPPVAFAVKLSEGKSEVQPKSMRGQILAHMREVGADKATSVADLEVKFGNKVRGAIQKLLVIGWLVRT